MLAPENSEIFTNTLEAAPQNAVTSKSCGQIGYRNDKFDNNQLIEFINAGKNIDFTKADIQTQLEKFLLAKNKIKKVNPIPNFKVRKPINERKIHTLSTEMKPKGGTTSKKKTRPNTKLPTRRCIKNYYAQSMT